MHKKIIPAAFVIVVAVLALIFICSRYFKSSDEANGPSRLIVPQISTDEKSASGMESSLEDEYSMTSLVPLKDDETLISVVSLDFDGDGYDDQVNAIKTMSSPYLSLLVGLYNPAESKYERVAVIATPVAQVRTFSYTGMDLTGEHKTALVYQGFADNGDSVMQAYFLQRKNGKFTLDQIAAFETDGTIFIQQVERFDAYERSQAKGASFPIWLYTTDVARANVTDQIQTRYDWDASEGGYVQTQQIRVAGSRLAAEELARIQDGTVETFASFLNGLWYKTQTDSSGLCYIFFDYDAREIIFFQEDEEKVYHWVMSTLRRNGIYLSTTNQDIESLQTRVDISLRGPDEIHVRMQDDIRLLIKESNLWDGDYKKISSTLGAAKKLNVEKKAARCVENLQKGKKWKLDDGTVVEFKNGAYTTQGNGFSDSGIFTDMQLGKDAFLQFRSNTTSPVFRGMYLVEKSDSENVVLQPYAVLPNESYPSESHALNLTHIKQEE